MDKVETSKAISLGASVLSRIEDSGVRELAIRNALMASMEVSIIGWLFEDELPSGYPYEEMYEFSKVDGVRLFPVFAPARKAKEK